MAFKQLLATLSIVATVNFAQGFYLAPFLVLISDIHRL